MKKNLLPQEGKFYKANLHCHSTYSDGRLTPEELKKIYKEKGYSILAITDHEGIFDHTYLDDEDFITIPGYEHEINDNSHFDPKVGWDSVRTTHLCIYPKDKRNINCICFDPDFTHNKFKWLHNPELRAKVTYLGEPYVYEPTVESVNHIIEEANKYGFLVTFNHPEWSQQPYEVYSQYKGMFAMEVANTASGAHDNNNSQIYDMMLRSGHRIFCIAADDNHNPASRPLDSVYSDSFGGFVFIKAEKLEHSKIIESLEKGNFYASTGPEIKELYIEDDVVHIETSPAKYIRLTSGNRMVRHLKADGELLTCADFKLQNIFDYFRIEVTDCDGKIAYTNPYFTDEL